MSANEAIEQLTQSVQQHTDTTQRFLNEADGRIAAKEQQVDDFIQGARGEYPFYRLTKNQRLLGTSGSPPDFWFSASGVEYTLVETVRANADWEDRTEIEKGVLTAIGSHGQKNIATSFNVWKMEWSDRNASYTLHPGQVKSQSYLSAIAVCKLLSGSINSFWAHGATNEWSITGLSYSRLKSMYTHPHPYRGSDKGSMLFALPCVVAGKHHFKNHGLHPYIGDATNE